MKKLMNKKGFTLMEMLIVVAIIVILVAVSIPTFTSSLDEAKSATDEANLRAAKGAAVTQELMTGWVDPNGDIVEGVWYYDADAGVFVAGEPEATYEGYGQSSAHKGEYIYVTVTDEGKIGTDDPIWSE